MGFTLLVIGLLVVLAPIAWAGLSFAPWVPTWKEDVQRAFRLAKLQPGEVMYDLGSGDGKTVFIAAEEFGARAVGIEIAWPLWLWSQLRRLWAKGETRFILGNLFRQDISNADVIYLFGMPDKLKDKLRRKLETDLKPGARVVSYSFSIPDWTPVLRDKPTGKISIYLYQR